MSDKDVFFAIGESAINGATDESIQWKGKNELKKAANAFANLSMQVFDKLECHQWENARPLAGKLKTALEVGCAQVEACMQAKKASAMVKDIQ